MSLRRASVHGNEVKRVGIRSPSLRAHCWNKTTSININATSKWEQRTKEVKSKIWAKEIIGAIIFLNYVN